MCQSRVSKYEKQKEIIKNSDEIIMEIKKEDVKVLSWECDMGSFAFHRDENGSWLYDEDEEFPVDKEKIENLLELFEEFGVAFMIEEVEDFEQYGLDTPELSVVFEYADIGEDKDKETKETFALYIGRDPKEQEVEESDKDTEEEVTTYARIGESKIIYQLTTEQYKKLKEITYDTLRHQELFWADFSDIYQFDILLENTSYTITSKLEGENRNWYYQDEELEIANIQSAIRGLRASSFTDKAPDQKEEINLTIYLDNENFPKVHIQLYRYDGEECIATVDGKAVAFVGRNRVVDLMEAVNSIVLKISGRSKGGNFRYG